MRRDRSKEDAGKSEASHIKHRLLDRGVSGQAAAFRARHKGRMLFVDGNAGDGEGVPQDQLDMFGENPSCATAELLIKLANKLGNTDVVLCEKKKEHRQKLREQFPGIVILNDHAEAPALVRADHSYLLYLGDPCGPADQGIEAMKDLGQRQLRSDFVLTHNEGFLIRLAGTTHPVWEKSRQLYLPPAGPGVDPNSSPDWWLAKLNRRHMALTPLIKPAGSFHYRVLIITNFLSDAAKRKPFEVAR